jgi:hypothetical protein
MARVLRFYTPHIMGQSERRFNGRGFALYTQRSMGQKERCFDGKGFCAFLNAILATDTS